MYISKLEIKNIKCFEEITIDFNSTNGVAKWGVILGNNGLGKTTILRSVAMSLCGKASVSGLMDELYGEWIRKGELKGSIRLEIKSEDKKEEPYSIETIFKRDHPDAVIEIDQDTHPKDFPWDDFFVCGYGASRGIIGQRPYREYSVTDAVYTLFNYDLSLLQNPELVIRRIKDSVNAKSNKSLARILHQIDEILMLPKDSTKLGKEGIDVSGPWGKSMPLTALGDGHQATLTWIIDMLGWALFYDDTMFQKEKISGIILVDEIEQHLHPLWQRRIVPLLKNVFPKIQFIMTTHSPLVAANTGKLSMGDPKSKLFYLRRDDDKTVQLLEIEENLKELNFDQILSSEAFGHIYNINPEIEDVLKEASILAAKDKRTAEEEAKYNKFKDELKEFMFPKGRTLIERIVERDYYKDLEKKIEDFKEILKKEEND